MSPSTRGRRQQRPRDRRARPRAACFVRRVSLRYRVDVCAAASAGVVLAALATRLSMRCRPALSCPASDPDQPWSLAAGERAVTGGPERLILAVHVRGLDGMCAGCRVWWALLVPYPCWQVEWATSRQARASVARFLEGVR
ncbi:hypothetical protein JMF97_12595 [Micromonospora fiedleri]|uniref:Uncharacterized protein n=1 Tax=Micromonospora fiedleri TaxID=1157498 RepID=A0ABS1UKX6_9ACTN|nr:MULTISPECIES: hypothetical protein [Micromonospora]MBL6277001.1 hypothetical protein [Micromonospora fiedleri]